MKLNLQKPLSFWYVGQKFGEDRACVNSSNNVIGKLTGQTCPAGYVSLYSTFGLAGHNGLDCYMFRGMPIHAAHDGIVEDVSLNVSAGLGVTLITKEKYLFEGGNYYASTRYWHLLSV